MPMSPIRNYRGNIATVLREDGLMADVAASLPKAGGAYYLQGRYVLEAACGRKPGGFILVCRRNAAKVAEAISSVTGRGAVRLEGHAETWFLPAPDERVVLVTTLDDSGIEGYLRSRSFSVLAMALDISQPAELVDPLGGESDLDTGSLTMCAPGSMSDDPARGLLAADLCHGFALYPDEETREELRSSADSILTVPARRLFKGLAHLLDGRGLSWKSRFLRWTGLLGNLLPEVAALYEVPQNYYHHLGVWEHTMEVLDHLEEMFREPGEIFRNGDRLSRHLDGRIQGLPRRRLLSICALVHDAGKADRMTVEPSGRIRFRGHESRGMELARDIAKRLGMGRRARRYLEGVVGGHMLLGFMIEEGETAEERLEVLRSLGDMCPDVVMLSMADRMATRGEASTGEGIERFRRTASRVLADYYWDRLTPGLVTGRDVIIHGAAPPGPRVGGSLRAVRVAQREGTVSSRRQALEYLAPDFKGRMS
jgi:poly(A) polymerase